MISTIVADLMTLVVAVWVCFKKEMKKMKKQYNFLEKNTLEIVKGDGTGEMVYFQSDDLVFDSKMVGEKEKIHKSTEFG